MNGMLLQIAGTATAMEGRPLVVQISGTCRKCGSEERNVKIQL